MSDLSPRAYWASLLIMCAMTAVAGGPAPHTVHPVEWHLFNFSQGLFPALVAGAVLLLNRLAAKLGLQMQRPRRAAVIIAGVVLVPILIGQLRQQ